MTVQFHYCCGKLKDITLSPVTVKQCEMDHSMSKKPCCNDKQLELKIKSDQRTEQATKFIFFTPVLAKQEGEIFTWEPTVAKTVALEIFAPPPKKDPLYILHCVYRI
ncbi:MAG TPA: hypothetical protein VL095_11290 [Flavisolibacter sp.]|nr:hypothetical protein [Flavisolibacter sp.]